MKTMWISFTVVMTTTLAVVSSQGRTFTTQCWRDDSLFSTNSNKTEEDNTFLDGYNDFPFRLLRQFISIHGFPKDYLFLSPINVWSALTFLYLGAENSTRTELENLLRFTDMDKTEVVNHLSHIKTRYLSQNSSSSTTLLLENTMYIQEDEPIREDCIANLQDFQMDVVKLNLTQDPEINQIIDGINALVAFQTNGRIGELIPLNYVDSNTRLFLVNTASFYGRWENVFDARRTRNAKFYIHPNHSMIVETMQQNNFFPYGTSSTLKCSAIQMPFLRSQVSVVILLPDDPWSKLGGLIANLNDSTLNDLIQDMQMEPISLTLPKIQLEQVVDLKDILKKFHLRHVFDPHQANLSGFSTKPGFHVRDIRHLPFIELNEKGTVPHDDPRTNDPFIRRSHNTYIPFRVNSPFVILFHHKITKTVLFTGLINRPTF